MDSNRLGAILTPAGRAARVQIAGAICRTVVLFSSSPIQKNKKGPDGALSIFLAGGEGFEPPLAESESAVLPLDDPPNKDRAASA